MLNIDLFTHIREVATFGAQTSSEDEMLAAATRIRDLAWEIKEEIFNRRMAEHRRLHPPAISTRRPISTPTIDDLL